jgi:hypothetical protein
MHGVFAHPLVERLDEVVNERWAVWSGKQAPDW